MRDRRRCDVSYSVRLLVTFPSTASDAVAAMAQRHLPRLKEMEVALMAELQRRAERRRKHDLGILAGAAESESARGARRSAAADGGDIPTEISLVLRDAADEAAFARAAAASEDDP